MQVKIYIHSFCVCIFRAVYEQGAILGSDKVGCPGLHSLWIKNESMKNRKLNSKILEQDLE